MDKKRLNKRQQRLERERRLKKKRRKRIIIIMVELLILAGLGVVAYGMFVMDKMDTTTLNTDDLNIYKSTGDYTNIALFGLDSREGELDGGVQSDCMMIASINNKTNEVKLISLYRDTLLKQENGKYQKANSAYHTGGPAEAIALMNRNLDLDIEKYISVNFNALADIIDALGGIDLDFTEDEIKYTNMYCDETEIVVGRETSRLEGAGTHHVDGIQAVAYSRIRYTSGMDFERTHRQRIVLEKIVEKAQSANVITLNKLINEIVPQISTNLTTGNFLALASKATNYKLSEMSGFPFEVTTCDNVKGHKGSYVAPVGLAKNVTELHQFLFGKEDYDPSDEVKEANDAIIELTGVDPETYKNTTDFTYKSGGEESDTSEKQNSK